MYDVTIATGRLGKDPERGSTQDGTTIARFGLAVDRGFGEKKSTLWYNVSVFGKSADACLQYLHKGDIVTVQGQVSLNEWVDQNSGEHKANLRLSGREVKFIHTKGNGDSVPPVESVDDMDIPF